MIPPAKRLERFLAAAIEFCDCERAFTVWRKTSRKCLEVTAPEYEVGDIGTPPCYLRPEDEQCEACRTFAANRELWQSAVRRKRLAKSRMLRNAPTIAEREVRA